MTKSNLLLALTLTQALSACTTITFVNDRPAQQTTEKSKWHHNFANGLIEGSEPIVLEQECDSNPWSSITTKMTPANALAATVTNAVSPPNVEVWSPKTVEISCAASSTEKAKPTL